jgi:hypothetical protein
MSSFKDGKRIFKENELSGSTPDIGVRTSLGGANEKPRPGRVSAVEPGEPVDVKIRDGKGESRVGGSSTSFTNRKSALSAFKKVRSDVNLEAMGSE